MMKSDPDICVCNPITENYTTFEILIQTSDPAFNLRRSSTRRRYNDFCWLRKILKRHHPLCTCPELPEKRQFSERFEIQFLVQRMKELEDWLLRIVSINLYLSDTALHLFLQSSLSIQQIEQYFKGSLPECDLQQAYKDAEVVIDKEAGLTSLEKSTEENASEGVTGSIVSAGAIAGLSLPVEIRPKPLASLHNNGQERSDSGIAEFDSDAESSYDSQGSPYVSSVDSSLITDKYPPLTEVSPVLITKNASENSMPESVSSGSLVTENEQHTRTQAQESLVYKIETVVNENKYDTDVQINVTHQNSQTETKVRALEDSVSQSLNINSIMDKSGNAQEAESVTQGDKSVEPKQVTRKVEMGVLFC